MAKTYYCIGMMSGTSLDGVDFVYVRINSDHTYQYEIIASHTYDYSDYWISVLKNAFTKPASELDVLHKEYGVHLGKLAKHFIQEYEVEKIDFISSHGHTIFHKPDQGITLQIGCGHEIAKVTNTKVVYDFRTQDVALGGQGAPLVPIGDALLFSSYDYCLNLGGFANVSYVENETRKAFDICPVNIVMNHYMNKIGEPYDDKGALAKSGTVHQELLQKLNQDPFYQMSHPKSLGFEFVKENVLPIIDSYSITLQDILRTFVEHVAIQISKVLSQKKLSTTLVTGGGAYNDFLISRIKQLCISEIEIPNQEIVEFKEALLFALLGLLKIEGKVNCLQSVTGASHDHSSGKISHG